MALMNNQACLHPFLLDQQRRSYHLHHLKREKGKGVKLSAFHRRSISANSDVQNPKAGRDNLLPSMQGEIACFADVTLLSPVKQGIYW